MDEEVVERLRRYVRAAPDTFWRDRRRVDAMIADACGRRAKALFLLRAAVEIVPELQASGAKERVRERLRRRLVSLGLKEPEARWAVDAWATALGLPSSAKPKGPRNVDPRASPVQARGARPKRRLRAGARRWALRSGLAAAGGAVVVGAVTGRTPEFELDPPVVTTIPFSKSGTTRCLAPSAYGPSCRLRWRLEPITQREQVTPSSFDTGSAKTTWRIGVRLSFVRPGIDDARSWEAIIRLCGDGDCFPNASIDWGAVRELPSDVRLHRIGRAHVYAGVVVFDLSKIETRRRLGVLHWLGGTRLRVPALVPRIYAQERSP